MSSPFSDIKSYSAFVYTLQERHPFVTTSTLALASVGAALGKLQGHVDCGSDIHLEVFELVDFAVGRIRTYSDEVYRAAEKLCWYDAWEHPEDASLSATFPHHKHLLPNLRDHRVPAPGISFGSPNLDVVLADIRREWLNEP